MTSSSRKTFRGLANCQTNNKFHLDRPVAFNGAGPKESIALSIVIRVTVETAATA